MPAQRPRASFEAIAPDFDLKAMIEETENFDYVDRITYEMVEQQGMEMFEKLVLLRVVIGGKPLVIDGFHDRLDPWTFTPKWLRDNHGQKVENARNLTAKQYLPLTLGHYLKNLGPLTEQFFEKPGNHRDKNRQRMYLKDIDCPPVWQDKLKENIPEALFYLNESTGEIGGPGAVLEPIPNTSGKRKGRGIAIAGDLMSSLPPEMRAENLMCYIGHEGTYTPAHREMCASLGQNIMVEASGTIGEDGKPERPGSSIWFMTESKDRHIVSEYWLSVLGHDIEIEDHFAQLVAWKRAPFKTYIVEQKPGDFILIPPLAPHQVWNRGTRTMKVAWNRTTVETLEMALNEALPNARMVCRDEQYKNKAIIYYTLQKYSSLLASAKSQSENSHEAAMVIRQSSKVRHLQKDFRKLLQLFKTIMLSEMFNPEGTQERPEFLPFDSNVTCAYCRGNIFNRFLTCPSCKDALGGESEEPYDVCMDCYAMGRSCACLSKLKWVEQWKWKDLCKHYEDWRRQIIAFSGGVSDNTPLTLQEERKLQARKSLAQVCQEQLKLRPWVDIKNPKPDKADQDEEEIQVNDDGTIKKTGRKPSKAYLKSHQACHVCQSRHPKWKMASCKTCEKGWCYGSLFRAHDLMPLSIMEDPNWQCPHCLQICSAGRCREDPRQHSYEPKGTLLGHDTRKVADARSVECLVDFSMSNLSWLREKMDEQMETSRLKKRREEAEKAKLQDPTLDDEDGEGEEVSANDSARNGNRIHGWEGVDQIEYSPIEGSVQAIDPRLISTSSGPAGTGNEGPTNGSTQKSHAPMSVSVLTNDIQNAEGETPVFVTDVNRQNLVSYETLRSYAASASAMNQMDGTDENSYLYPDPDLVTGQPPPVSRKRAFEDGHHAEAQIKLSPPKRRKSDNVNQPGTQPRSSTSKSEALKEFRKEKLRRTLEEAKKAGRLYQVHAAMKGLKKVVKFQLSPDVLAQVRAQFETRTGLQHGLASVPAGSLGDSTQGDRVIVSSDIGLTKPAPKPKLTSAPQNQKQFRYRVEDDDDFEIGRERRSTVTGSNGKAKPKAQYEEVSLASDDDEVLPNTSEKGRGRRISSWLARKNQDSTDLPNELPSDWKDGRAGRDRRDRRPAQPKPPRPPKAEPAAKQTIASVEISSETLVATPVQTPSSRQAPAKNGVRVSISHQSPHPVASATKSASAVPKNDTVPKSAVEIAKSAAAMFEEENRRAKLQAAQWAEHGFQSDPDYDSESTLNSGHGIRT